ncbi:MAG: [protein-PII] uridylyltransferase [Methylococcales bacterium]
MNSVIKSTPAQTAITEPLSIILSTDLFSTPQAIQVFKQHLKDQNETLKQRYHPQQSVNTLLTQKSDAIDALLRSAWQHFLGEHGNHLCLLAVGGYGRRELFPHSDIDIVILLPENQDRLNHQQALSNFSSFLWDIGLKPGQSVRTLSECIQAAIDDQTIMTGLLEHRLIAGDQGLHEAIRAATRSNKMWPPTEFFQAKMQEQQQRYLKYHDTAYNLEPNIKEGPGGLRDLQIIAWVFKRYYDTETLEELVKYDFLPEEEFADLIAAREVIWRIRYALHLLTGRCEDRLLFDHQRDLAQQFGFNATQGGNADVEQFMQFYFKTVVGLERLNEMLLQLFNERFIATETKRVVINANFDAYNGYLEARDESVFATHPLALLEIFLLLQQSPSLKGVRATTIRLIRKNLHQVDEAFRHNPNANRIFMEILRQPRGITHELKRMNRYGVLAAYLPSFANIVARMQYDLFHIYTVDEHTLFLIRNLRRFSLQKHSQDHPFCNAIFMLISQPHILYIAALFHDIAKGKKGDHSELGEQIARDFCVQHKLSSHDTKLVTWLVRNHLIMSMTAQRKDISDPDIIHQFAMLMGSVEYLNYLYLLTVADIRATNPELWNGWKDTLLKELYIATHHALRRGLSNPIIATERLNENITEAKQELIKLGMSEQHILESWKHVSDDYFLRYSADEISWHTIAIAASSENELPLVLLRPQTQRGSVEVFVYTHNGPNIFSLSTATLDQLGLTILDARIITTQDDYILNSFQILEQSGEPIKDLYRELHICTALRQNLINKTVKQERNIRYNRSRQAQHFPIPTSISFHADNANQRIILELITTDCAGLLSIIGQVFTKFKLELHSAKITTIGSRAEDMFYLSVKDKFTMENIELQEKIRSEINQQLAAIRP